MILYFANRFMDILGQASAKLPGGLAFKEDYKQEDVETGVSTFECIIPYDEKTREKVDVCTSVGNYFFCKDVDEYKFYTIIEREKDTKSQEVYIYAEDAGLDLLNEVVGPYEADKAYSINHYINKFTNDSGFEIGINEVKDLTRKLGWDGESTVTERIASVATQFDNCEISYSFEIVGLEVTKKLINIYKKRGQDNGITLMLNRDIDRIITKESIANLATALEVTGGTPETEGEEEAEPITLKGYKYDDGNFFVDANGKLKSREANKKWSRYIWHREPNQLTGNEGYIVKQYSYDTTSQATLCAHAITELKKLCEIEVNYEVDLQRLPEGVKVGDRVNIVDDASGLYLSTRILLLKTSETEQTQTATLGEYLIKDSGISQKVAELAAKFAENSQSALRALEVAKNAKEAADDAKTKVDEAVQSVEDAQQALEEVAEVVETAKQSAATAQAAADAAQAVVESVETRVSGLEVTVTNAQKAADNADFAAQLAQAKANEANLASQNAQANAINAQTAAEQAKNTANTAVTNAQNAQNTANEAKTAAEEAQSVAAGAKEDAKKAQEDINAFAENLETVEQTMSADYARKTDLTETKASLQTQITQNAALLSSTVSMLTTIDETANDAESLAEKAQAKATEARAQADQATRDAEQAQEEADEALQAANNAQAEADTANAAAEIAQNVAAQAKADLEAAQADLETVKGRVDATEEEIAQAQAAVDAARLAADKAKTDANKAVQAATEVQNTADIARANAEAAQAAANTAASFAKLAQSVANEAQAAYEAQNTADNAAGTAEEAQQAANNAKTDADNAKAAADAARAEAEAAQSAADSAEAKAQQAQADLETARENLADVQGRVGATEEEVEAAKAAVEAAQAAADKAKADAATAQSTADTAKTNAANAQSAANTAKQAADAAQKAATDAQAAADKAQEDVNALTVRVTSAETKITQNAEKIEFAATKTEVAQTLGGYYKKTETDSLIQQTSSSIRSSVSSEITEKINNVEIGGRNLLRHTGSLPIATNSNGTDGVSKYVGEGGTLETTENGIKYTFSGNVNDGLSIPLVYEGCIESGEEITWSFEYRGNITNAGYFYLLQRTYPNAAYHLSNILEMSESEWKKCVVTFAIPAANDRVCFQALMFYATSYTSNEWIEIKKGTMKLEKGNKATDWTPAPEDMATGEEVENAQTSANNAQDTASDAQSRVSYAETIIQQLSDSISMLVTDSSGASLMTQTANGWTFSTGSLQSAIDSASSSLNTLTEDLGSTDATVSVLEQAVKDLEETAEYVRIGTWKDEETGETLPCVELGESDSDFALMITNKKILFRVGSGTPTQITTDGLETDNITVKKELRHGAFVWQTRANGNYGLAWKGGSV